MFGSCSVMQYLVSFLVLRSSCIRKFCQRGFNFDTIFLGEGGSKKHYKRAKRAIICPPAKHHLNGVSLAGRWWPNNECWLGSFVIFSGPGPILLGNPIFCDFSGGGGGSGPLPPPPWICAWIVCLMFCGCQCFLVLPRGAVGGSKMCDCRISWSY